MHALLNSFAFLGQTELIVIVVLVLLLFGGAKIPQLMRGLGRGMGEFQKGIKEGKDAMDEARANVSTDESS